MIEQRRVLALDIACELYSQFGWSDPPVEELEKIQQLRFGDPIHT
jgi:hypothetical protein